MPNYDFLNLSPFDFEELTRDLLQKHFNIYFESFTTGRDKGIDLRYSLGRVNNIIIQCKRYNNFKSLKSGLKKEIKKVKALNPQKYVLSTTAGLTPSNKDEIIEIFDGYIKNPSDILGRDDLNNLLNQYSEIEKKHFKLWLSNVSILQSLINNDVINRSDFEEEKISREINIYVQNNSFNDAVDILNIHNYVIISGIPGIGKTILARILIFNYLRKDFELVAVSSDINEADSLYIKGKKQIFYYDDFLGRNFLEDRLKKNEDQRLFKFIERIKNNPNKKLLMTTREYILNQAILKYEIFANSNLEVAKCIVDLEKYTKLIRAKILYNHLFYSNLPVGYIQALLVNNNYLKIINHTNYNPRIIQIMTDVSRIGHVSEIEFFGFFTNSLDNPINIWEHSFTNQISLASNYLLFALLISGDPIYEENLENAFWELYSNESRKFNFEIKREDYHNSLKELENTFITIEKDQSGKKLRIVRKHSPKILIQFQNPSIRDFLLTKVRNNKKLILSLLKNAIYFNQLFDTFTINPKYKHYKILLDNEIISNLIKIVIQKFNTLENISLHKVYFANTNEYYWSQRNLSKIQKLYEIASLIDPCKFNEIREFLLSQIPEFGNKETLTYNDMKPLLNLLIILRKYYDVENSNFIKRFLSSVETFEDLLQLAKIKQYFRKPFRKIYIDNKDEIVRKIFEVVNSEIDYVSADDSIDSAEELKYNLEKIGKSLKIDFNDAISDLTRIIEEQPYAYDPDDDLEHYSKVNDSEGSEERLIQSMFESLN